MLQYPAMSWMVIPNQPLWYSWVKVNTGIIKDMSQALYRKWRPHRWEDVVGQEHVVQPLRNSVAANRMAHAYLFAGSRGTGKTTTARLLAKALNCLDTNLAERPCDTCDHCVAVNQGRFMDLIEIDAASNTSVEDVRDLRDKINFSPNQGKYKVYIIDEVHMLSTAAFNALLKTLEEPPAHAVFILATTEAHKIPATVLSRCQRHEFRRIPVIDIVGYLKRIVQAESIVVSEDALLLVARQAAGGMRDAISLLDQLASSGKAITLEMAHAVLGTATNHSVVALFDALVQRDPAAGLDAVAEALDAGTDPRQLARQMVDYARLLLMIQVRNSELIDAAPEARPQMAQHSQAFTVADLLRLIKVFNQAVDSKSNWMPGLPLEMAFLDAIAPPAAEAPRPHAVPQRAPVHPAGTRPITPPAAAPTRQTVPEPEPETPTGDASENRQLDQNWRRILDLTRQHNAQVYALLNSIKARTLKDDVLTLAFATDLLKFKLEVPATLQVVAGVMKEVFGREIQVRSVTVSGKRSAPPPGVDSDGMVASALRDLGGEIVDIH